MFYIPLNYPITFFILGALACSLFCNEPPWLRWILTLFLSLFRWKSIRNLIGYLFNLFIIPLKIFNLADLRIIHLLQYQNLIPSPKGHPPNSPSTKQLTDLISGVGNLTAGSFVLFIGAGTHEQALVLYNRTGCRVIIIDDDLLKVQAANDVISNSQLWSKVQCVLVDKFSQLEYEDGAFDAVFSLEPTFWLGKRSTAAIMLEWLRVLKTDGLLHMESMIFIQAFPWKSVPLCLLNMLSSSSSVQMDLGGSSNRSGITCAMDTTLTDIIESVLLSLRDSENSVYLSYSHIFELSFKVNLIRLLFRLNMIECVSFKNATFRNHENGALCAFEKSR